ncbi:HGL303Cp [Eremothecium sinecaudum]|uniref:5-demethoxyubiquinone hydroxylase, mitochondrial n=1 Tax=Eremothecium sinecaudum TaxID=45286 RepID=A0A120K2M9_9SACH|nr:HGL303Cp [Eremothecium sinecaudum]AMD22037.1 HGL303Cp [Eremothecium sinecaudum]
MLFIAKNSATRRLFSIVHASRAESSKAVKTTTSNENEKFEALSDAQKAYLNRVIRVDQAGELGANYIYAGQYFVLANKHRHLKPILQEMWDQEIQHHKVFNELQLKRRVRPSLLTPMWKVGAFAMGSLTALLSPAGAMACTEAVETVIGNHYNAQLRCLNDQFQFKKPSGVTGQSEEIKDLASTIAQFRDEELEHLDTAVLHDSHKAVPYMLLTGTIKTICRAAIWTAERV